MIDAVVLGAGHSSSRHQTRNWVMSRCPAPAPAFLITTACTLHTVPCWEHLHCGVSKHRGGISAYKLTRCHSLSPLSPDVPSLGLWELGGDNAAPSLVPAAWCLAWDGTINCSSPASVGSSGESGAGDISAVFSSRWRQQTAAPHAAC